MPSTMFNVDMMQNGWVPGGMAFFVLLMVWSLFWKGLALWHSARRGEPVWFMVLLIVNTAGILELVYLFAVAKVKTDELFKFKK